MSAPPPPPDTPKRDPLCLLRRPVRELLLDGAVGLLVGHPARQAAPTCVCFGFCGGDEGAICGARRRRFWFRRRGLRLGRGRLVSCARRHDSLRADTAVVRRTGVCSRPATERATNAKPCRARSCKPVGDTYQKQMARTHPRMDTGAQHRTSQATQRTRVLQAKSRNIRPKRDR